MLGRQVSKHTLNIVVMSSNVDTPVWGQPQSSASSSMDGLHANCAMPLDSQGPHMQPVQPLLVISYRTAFTKVQYNELSKHIEHLSNLTGWRVCVVDGMDEAKVQAFGLSLPTLDTLSLDSIIELLEGLKRVRDEQVVDGKAVAHFI